MSNETASLVIAVDSTGAKNAAVDLDKLAATSDKLEASTARLNVQTGKAAVGSLEWARAESTANASLKQKAESTVVLSSEVQRLIDRYDPLSTKMRSLQSEMALIEKANKSLGNSYSEGISKTIKGLEADIEKTAKTMSAAGVDGFEQMGKAAERGAFATAGARRELLVLGHEAMTGNFSRMPGSFMVLAERMHLTSALFSPLAIGLAAFTAAGAGLGVMVYHAEKLAQAMNTLDVQMAATGRAGQITTTQFKELIDKMALMPGVTKDAAEQVISTFTKTHQIGAPLLQELTSLVADYARATGTDVVAASKEMAKAFADPEQGAKSFDKALGTLSESTILQIKNMQDSNNMLGAQKLLHDALAESVLGLANRALTPLQQATHGVTVAWDAAMKSMGDSSALKIANSSLLSIIRSVEWLIKNGGGLSPALDGVGNAIKSLPVVGRFAEIASAIGSAGKGKGRSASGLVTEDPVEAVTNNAANKALEDMTKNAMLLGGGYTSAASKTADFSRQTKVLTEAINANVAAGNGDSEAVKKLRDQLVGLQESQQGKSKAVKDTSSRELANALQEQQTGLDREKNLYDERVNMLNTYHSKLGLSDADFYAGKTNAQNMYLVAEAAAYAKEVELVQSMPGKDAAAVAQRQGALDTLYRAHLNNIDRIGKAQLKSDVDLVEESNKRYDDISRAVEKSGASEIQSLESTLVKLREKNVEIGKTKEQIDLLRSVQETAGTADLQLQADAYDLLLKRADIQSILGDQDRDIYEKKLNYLNREISLRKDVSAQLIKNAQAEKIADENDKQVKLLENVDKAAESAFVNIAENGSNAFKKIGQTLKTAVLDMLYQMTLKKWIISVTGSVTGASASAMDQASGAGSGGLLSGASNAYSLYGAASGFSSGVNTAAGFLGAGTSAGASGASLAYANGVGAVGGDGLGALIASNASWGGVAAASSTALVASNTALATTIGISTAEAAAGATAAAAAGAGGAAAAGGLTAALGAIPVWGWAALAGVAALSIFSKKGIASQSTGSMERSYDESGAITSSKSPFSAGNGASVVDGLQAQFTTMKNLMGATGGSNFSYGGYSGNDNKNPMMRVGGGSFNSGEIANTEENSKLAASRAVLGALMQSNLPRELAGVFNGLDPAGMSQKNIDDIYAYAQALKALDVNLLASPFTNLKNLSYDAAQGLIKASGGLEKLIPNLASYYDNFYSAEEKRVRVINDITNTLNAAGANVTTSQIGTMSRDAFRAMVDAAGSNMQLNAALLSVNGAFASITPAATAAAASIAAISDTLKGLQKDRATLQTDVMQARGDTGGADAVRRALTVANYTAVETADYDYNQSLRQEIKTLQDATAATAASQAAELAAAQAKASERQTLQTQLNGLTDTAAQALARQRDALNDDNKALFDSVQVIIAQKTATQEAALAAQAAASERKSLQTQLNGLTDTAAQALDRQRSGLNESNRSLFDQVQALIAQKAATQESTLAATQAAAAQKAAAVAAMQAATTAVTNAFNQVNAAANDQKTALSATFQALTTDINAQLSTVGASIGKLQSLSSSLKSALDGMQISGGQNAARVDAQSTIAAMLETAKSGGGLPVNTQALNSALSTISKPSDQLFGSFVDYARDFYKTSNNISALNDLTTKGLTSEQVVEATLKAQLAIEKASYDSQITQITAAQNQAKAQLDAFNGNTTVLTTLKDALALFSKTLADAVALNASQIVGAIVVLPPQIASAVAVLSASDRSSAVQSASTKATQNGTDYELELYKKAKALGYSAADADKALGLAPGATAGYIARTGLAPLSATSAGATAGSLAPAYVSAVAVLSAADRESVVSTALKNAAQNGTDYQLELYKYAKSIGYKAEDVDRALGLAAGATKGYISSAGLTQLSVGTNYVPQDMIAQIHEGEAVVPKAFNPAAGGGSGDSEGLKNEIKAMRLDLNAALLKIAQNTGKTAKINDRWESDGLPATRTTT